MSAPRFLRKNNKKLFYSILPNSHLAKLVFTAFELHGVSGKLADGFAFPCPALDSITVDSSNRESGENFHFCSLLYISILSNTIFKRAFLWNTLFMDC